MLEQQRIGMEPAARKVCSKGSKQYQMGPLLVLLVLLDQTVMLLVQSVPQVVQMVMAPVQSAQLPQVDQMVMLLVYFG